MDEDGSEPIHIAWASSCCQPWSTFGLGKGQADSRSIPLIIWLEERRQRVEDVLFFENSTCFPVSILSDNLPRQYRIFHFHSNPEDYGFPVARDRLLCFAFDTTKYVWFGPAQDELQGAIIDVFGKTVACDGDVFCVKASGHASTLASVLDAFLLE